MARTKSPAPSRADLPLGLDQLLTTTEVATGLGYKLTAFKMLRTRPDHPFPPSDLPPGQDPKWRVSTVNRWIAEEAARGVRV
jgi:hypothetical protein